MTQILDAQNNLIDPFTGEQIQDEIQVTDLVVSGRQVNLEYLLTGSSSTPRHIEELRKLNLPPMKRAALLATFTGSEPQPLKSFLGQEIGITGAIVYFSGAYMSKTSGQVEDGFYTILLQTDLMTETKIVVNDTVKKLKKPIILKCSGKKVSEWALMMIDACGWYTWEETIKVVFSQGEDNAYYLTPVE